MTDLKIEAGKCYRTRDGRRAHVAFENEYRKFAGLVVGSHRGLKVRWWYPSGRFDFDECSADDLISEWKEPRKGEVWTNLYEDTGGTVTARGYASKAIADDAAQHDKGMCGYRFACAGPIPWTEGQGLDGEGSE